jgi:hypothetical protein
MVCEWFDFKTTRTVFFGLASKLVVTVFSGLALKSVVRVSQFEPQNRQLRVGNLGIKITTIISWFVPQNKAVFNLSVTPQNRRREDGAGHALRSSGLLHLKASHNRVFQTVLKTGGGAITGGACGTITEVV